MTDDASARSGSPGDLGIRLGTHRAAARGAVAVGLDEADHGMRGTVRPPPYQRAMAMRCAAIHDSSVPRDLPRSPEPCARRHPGWGDGADYRRLTDDPPRVRRVSAPTPALLIDHALGPHLFPDVEASGYRGAVSLATGTLLLWVGSSYPMHYSGGALHGAHVLQVLNGDLRGECVEVRVKEEGCEDRLPDTMPPAGETQGL